MTALAKTDVWDFKRDARGRWHWQRQSLFGELLLEGRTTFSELDECFADAKRHGYVTQAPLAEAPTQPRRKSARR
jgi:hypothetical protein